MNNTNKNNINNNKTINIEIKEMPHYHIEYTLIDNGSQLVVLRDLLDIWIFYINDNDGNEIELQI